MIYPVVKYGDAVLEKTTKPVEKFDEELAKLCEDMFESMYAANGVGLAAPQIGLGQRLAVVDVTVGKNPEAKIVWPIRRSFTPKASSARKRAASRFRAFGETWRGRNT